MMASIDQNGGDFSTVRFIKLLPGHEPAGDPRRPGRCRILGTPVPGAGPGETDEIRGFAKA